MCQQTNATFETSQYINYLINRKSSQDQKWLTRFFHNFWYSYAKLNVYIYLDITFLLAAGLSSILLTKMKLETT